VNATSAATAAYSHVVDGQKASHACAHVKRYEIVGNGQNFLLMNLKWMLCERTHGEVRRRW
jgi:hypothetical protein